MCPRCKMWNRYRWLAPWRICCNNCGHIDLAEAFGLRNLQAAELPVKTRVELKV